MVIIASALNEVLTERYLIFRKQKRFLFWDYTEEINVRIPKDYIDNYKEELIKFKMKCAELFDQGYNNGYITEEMIDCSRKEIADYFMSKNKVWE
jgi:hypothetical protein